jgi:hypothetical protein
MRQDGTKTAYGLGFCEHHELFQLLRKFAPIEKVGLMRTQLARLVKQPFAEIAVAREFLLSGVHVRSFGWPACGADLRVFRDFAFGVMLMGPHFRLI